MAPGPSQNLRIKQSGRSWKQRVWKTGAATMVGSCGSGNIEVYAF